MTSSKNTTTTNVILGALGTLVAAAALHFTVTRYVLQPKRPQTRVYGTKDDLIIALCKYIVQEINNSTSQHKENFYLAVAGGSLLDILAKLVDFKDQADFSSVVLCFANHKCIDVSSEKATAQKAKMKFADALGMTVIAPEITTTPAYHTQGINEAEDYGRQLLRANIPHTGRLPKFDLVLLGLGADGHVASCHPNSEATQTKAAVTYSPKVGEPPSITLSMQALNNARQIVVVVCGGSKGKKEAVKRAMIRPAEEPRGSFPAQLIDDPLYFLDMDAAEDLYYF